MNTHEIYHRDLKPANFLIDNKNGKHYIHVIDFGLAKDAKLDNQRVFTSVGSNVGTYEYMAPEYLLRDRSQPIQIFEKQDVWAIGVIAY